MHTKSDVDRLYITRKEGGRGLCSIEYAVRGEENSLGYHMLNSEETLLRGWDLCKRHEIEHQEKWYDHIPDSVVENDSVKLLWDIHIQCDNVIEARRSGIVVLATKERFSIIVDIAVPADRRVEEKEQEKVGKYQDLKTEIGRMWGIRKVQVVPAVIGALGSVPKGFDKWIEKLDIQCNIVDMQKTALLGTARILRKVLEM